MESKQMTKSDLKTGMWVVLRNGKQLIVQLNAESILRGKAYVDDMLIEPKGRIEYLSSYLNNLTHPVSKALDIVQVRRSKCTADIFDFAKTELLWEDKEAPTITSSECEFLRAIKYKEDAWIARDSYNTLKIYVNSKPFKDYGLELQSELFPFITWEDNEEPWSVLDLWRLNVKD